MLAITHLIKWTISSNWLASPD